MWGTVGVRDEQDDSWRGDGVGTNWWIQESSYYTQFMHKVMVGQLPFISPK